MKKRITIGILAHVDAGKTTLSEALLYLAGKLRSLGRVDHGNTFLDSNVIERERGITVFSKMARFSTDACDFILLDTPGHTDLSAETERVLSLLDYAILVISAPDGIQSHTRTLWQLLEHYSVPTFIFYNKTDVCFRLKSELEEEAIRAFGTGCVAFFEEQSKSELDERLALISEELLEDYLSGEPISDADIAVGISERRIFPCFFGSALKTDGVGYLISLLEAYALTPSYPTVGFGGKVYKISYVAGTRLTYIKVTSGKLRTREEIRYATADGQVTSEKINQIRLYSGERYEQVDEVLAGEICALTGLTGTYVGQGLGVESNTSAPLLEPVLSYRIKLPDGCDPVIYYARFKELEEEEPSLHLYWNPELTQIEARFMGDIQTELIQRSISDKFGIECEFDAGRILYKEKAASTSIGVGHFEPLRHYAEVQLLIEPQPAGTGLVFDTNIPDSSLDKSWQRLILSHLYEKNHRGTLTGAQLTDTKITLVAGRAHQKHTEGGDFREATLRAVRHGLMKSGCVLLEPFFKFRLEVPTSCVGRAMSDLQMRSAEFEIESANDSMTVICGRAPAIRLHGYSREVISYTRGEGRFSCVSDGYASCHNTDEIVALSKYDPEADLENTPHSVFCSHGAGVTVPWQEVDAHKHIDFKLSIGDTADRIMPSPKALTRRYSINDDELERIMLRTFGPIKRRRYSEPKVIGEKKEKRKKLQPKPDRRLLIVDGYNVIYSWKDLNELADFSLDKARETLTDVLTNFAAFTKDEIVLVFDAYRVKEGVGSEEKRGACKVVYTRQDQTADAYIERLMRELGPDYSVHVVTGDRLVQFSAVTSGILRMTSAELEEQIIAVNNEISQIVRKYALEK